jgi:hypothetical protein
VGAIGRRLAGNAYLGFNSPAGVDLGGLVQIVGNGFSSSYNSLQVQFNRRLSKRIQALASWTWSHSIDDLSTDGSNGVGSNLTAFEYPNLNRGPSDFDVRQSLHGAVFASLPAPRSGLAALVLRNWTASSIFFARSALPTDVLTFNEADSDYVRPDLVPGQPLYLYSANYPGGKRYNPAAFTTLPSGAVEGNFGRNVLRGFGAWQVDLALHRNFHLSEKIGLQVRAEAFNIFNHPNFGNPADGTGFSQALVRDSSFGLSRMTLASGLGASGSLGQLDPSFQVGGPRTLQFALRMKF